MEHPLDIEPHSSIQLNELSHQIQMEPPARQYSTSAYDEAQEIEKITTLLPPWVTPGIIYPWHSITKVHLLGIGEYGAVYKGIYNQGNAKYALNWEN